MLLTEASKFFSVGVDDKYKVCTIVNKRVYTLVVHDGELMLSIDNIGAILFPKVSSGYSRIIETPMTSLSETTINVLNRLGCYSLAIELVETEKRKTIGRETEAMSRQIIVGDKGHQADCKVEDNKIFTDGKCTKCPDGKYATGTADKEDDVCIDCPALDSEGLHACGTTPTFCPGKSDDKNTCIKGTDGQWAQVECKCKIPGVFGFGCKSGENKCEVTTVWKLIAWIAGVVFILIFFIWLGYKAWKSSKTKRDTASSFISSAASSTRNRFRR